MIPTIIMSVRSRFLELIELQAGGWAGGRPISELLAAIERAGAESFAGKVRTALGS